MALNRLYMDKNSVVHNYIRIEELSTTNRSYKHYPQRYFAAISQFTAFNEGRNAKLDQKFTKLPDTLKVNVFPSPNHYWYWNL
jgi:hypothetical protein